jgi:beta-glucuronidase
MVRIAEELGLMIWEEIPVYWTIDWTSENAFRSASDQLKEVIRRDKNRAGTIIWSISNETPVIPERLSFLRKLVDTVRAYDNTRLISSALLIHKNEGLQSKSLDDPMAEYVDVVSFNHYHGWYGGRIEELSTLSFDFNDVNKPVLVSEFGAGALKGYHNEEEPVIWTEEYQDFLYRETLKMMDNISQLRGFTPWILADFRSPRRFLPGIQDGWNRKGLISETGDKKKAFYTLREFYRSKSR